jgi:hypothetical protein
MDCGSGGGGSAQLWPDRYGGGVIGGAGRSGGGSWISTAVAWIWRRGGRPMRERYPSTTRRRQRCRWWWEWSCVGGQCRWRSDGELRSVDGLTQQSGGWINRMGRLTRGAARVKIDRPGDGVDEGSGRLRGSEHNRIPCRNNRLHIIVGCLALCLSVGIYRVQESWGVRHLWIHMVVYNT